MNAPVLLGLDLGTSGVKAMLLPASGGEPLSHTVDLTLDTPRPGWSEQHPETWWTAAVTAIRAVLERSGVAPGEIVALATSGQMHGATLLDGTGTVLRPAILWNDARTGAQCDAITERVGLAQLLAWVANPALAGFTLPKLLWVREHEPEVFDRIATVLLPKDYLTYRLTGELVTEASDASGTLLFDVARRRWSADLAGALDIALSILPPVHESSAVVGRITAAAAGATGLREGTPVVAGGADNACAAVGMGVTRPGQVLASVGTSGTLVAPTASPDVDPQGRLHTFCHAVPNTWYAMGVVLSAGGSLRWFRDTLGDTERAAAQRAGRDPYDLIVEEAAAVPPGSEGLIFLPYLSGERTPHGDPNARGAFVGLSLRHTRAHLARSVIEGVTFALADAAGLMRDLGIDLDTIRMTGGGAHSALWRQLLADVLGCAVVTATADAGPALGAAILAGVGVGVYPSVAEGASSAIDLTSLVEPRSEQGERYRRLHRVYAGLYGALKPSFDALSGMQQ